MKPFEPPVLPPIPNSKIHQAADLFRKKHWKNKPIPVDIDLIIEKMGIYTIPLPGLRDACSMDACLASDCTTIYMHYNPNDFQAGDFRLRFSLAHEIGHLELHRAFYKAYVKEGFAGALEWAKTVQEQSTRIYGARLEREANEFAGRLLVPPDVLNARVEDAIAKAGTSTLNGVDEDSVRDYLGAWIYREFEVNAPVIAIRLRVEKLYPRP